MHGGGSSLTAGLARTGAGSEEALPPSALVLLQGGARLLDLALEVGNPPAGIDQAAARCVGGIAGAVDLALRGVDLGQELLGLALHLQPVAPLDGGDPPLLLGEVGEPRH